MGNHRKTPAQAVSQGGTWMQDAGTELGPALWWGRVRLLGSIGLGFPECARWGVAFDKFLLWAKSK